MCLTGSSHCSQLSAFRRFSRIKRSLCTGGAGTNVRPFSTVSLSRPQAARGETLNPTTDLYAAAAAADLCLPPRLYVVFRLGRNGCEAEKNENNNKEQPSTTPLSPSLDLPERFWKEGGGGSSGGGWMDG